MTASNSSLVSTRSPRDTFQSKLPTDSFVIIPLPVLPDMETDSFGLRRLLRLLGSMTRAPSNSSEGTASKRKSRSPSFGSVAGLPFESSTALSSLQ